MSDSNFQQKSTTEQSVPLWLSTPGPVLMKRNLHQSKYEPIVEQLDLIEANPEYVHVHLADDRETIGLNKQFASAGSSPSENLIAQV